jgi:hypothetical protein
MPLNRRELLQWMGGVCSIAALSRFANAQLAGGKFLGTKASLLGNEASTIGPDSAGASMRPFIVEWPAEAESPADVSFLLSAPAGKDGFIRSKNGHLVQPNGARFRIWGFNATGQAGLPAKVNAPILASNLARRGINCIRFHFLDVLAPSGLIDASRNDTQALDPQQLDRLDFFINELKKRGIYADLNLNVARVFKAGDGVRDYELISYSKALTYFDERLIELQKMYARQLLTHANPYTGNAYCDEPAVAMVEFLNENSLVEAWSQGRLLGKQTTKPNDSWHDIPPSYAEELTGKYNAWLEEGVSPELVARLRTEAGVSAGQPIPRLAPDQFKSASKERFEAEAGFYMSVERAFFKTMSAYLRNELGVKPLLIGNSDHNHGTSGYPIVQATSTLDIVDGHDYWQHPSFPSGPGPRKATDFSIRNSPMVDDPSHSTVARISRTPMAGKPFTVSELNHPFPNEFACEAVPITAAYGALQDWDGIIWYTLAHKDFIPLEPAVHTHFDFARDPVKMTELAAGALIFLRADVGPAERTIVRSYTREEVIDSILLPSSEQPFYTPGFASTLALQHAVRVTSFDGPPTGQFEAAPESPIRSDTGELSWSFGMKGAGLVTVDAPRSQAFIGYCGGIALETKNLAAKIKTPFCAITLASLDSKPIASSSHLLLTATARMANSGMVWNGARTGLTAWGEAPTCIEPVTGQLIFTNLQRAKSITAQPLDGAGRKLGAAIPARRSDEGWMLSIGEPATTWFVVSVLR